MPKLIKINCLNNTHFTYESSTAFWKEFNFATEILSLQANGSKIKKGLSYQDIYFKHNYFKLGNKIFAIANTDPYLYKTDRCSVKICIGPPINQTDANQYVIKSEKKPGKYSLEGEIGINSGLLVAPRVVRLKKGDYFKRYAIMYFLGKETLSAFLKRTHIDIPSEDFIQERLKTAIQLFLAIDAFHSGKSFYTKAAYMHGDLKPGNIIYDKNQLFLIDCGTAIPLSTDLPVFKSLAGRTLAYLPCYRYSSAKEENLIDILNELGPTKTDIFAALRILIFPTFPEFNDSNRCRIFPTEIFKRFSPALQHLLNTYFEGENGPDEFKEFLTDIASKPLTPKFFAALFISLKIRFNVFKSLELEKEWLDLLLHNEPLQNNILECYVSSNGNLLNPDELNSSSNNSHMYHHLEYADFDPIFTAIKQNNFIYINQLDRKHPSLNKVFMDSKSLLIKSIQLGNIETARALINQRADINHVDEDAETAVSYAVEKNYRNLVHLLYLNNANMHQKDMKGNNLLHKAILKKGTAVALFLIEQGCVSLTEENNQGLNPLLLAGFTLFDIIFNKIVQVMNLTDDSGFLLTEEAFNNIYKLLPSEHKEKFYEYLIKASLTHNFKLKLIDLKTIIGKNISSNDEENRENNYPVISDISNINKLPIIPPYKSININIFEMKPLVVQLSQVNEQFQAEILPPVMNQEKNIEEVNLRPIPPNFKTEKASAPQIIHPRFCFFKNEKHTGEASYIRFNNLG